MANTKSILYNSLKHAALNDPEIVLKQYVLYTIPELKALNEKYSLVFTLPDDVIMEVWGDDLGEAKEQAVSAPSVEVVIPPAPKPEPEPEPEPDLSDQLEQIMRLKATAVTLGPTSEPSPGTQPHPLHPYLTVDQFNALPLKDRGEQRAGKTFNLPEGTPIRRDSQDRVWFLDEVMKPAIPQPRMRRTTRYIDPGVEERHTYLPNGKIDETFEVAGTENRVMETKTTLPSYQVGVYKDPRLPFRVHIYGNDRGFDYDEVNRFYGGLDLVPAAIKTKYVHNDLCYDISSTREQMNREHNDLLRYGANNG